MLGWALFALLALGFAALMISQLLIPRVAARRIARRLTEGGGRLRVTGGGGTVAGYPAGPLATLLAATVARRLELTP